MNEARVDHIEEALTGLDRKVDGLGRQLQETAARLDKKIDDGFANAFGQTQGGFDDHRRYAEFLAERAENRLSEEMAGVRGALAALDGRLTNVEGGLTSLGTQMGQRFNQVDRRFDGFEDRFDRLEKLITEK